MNDVKIKKALKNAHSLFEKYDLTIWLDSGTLLGAVREGKVIPWDNDIDLAAWTSDFKKINHNKFWKDAEDLGFDCYLLKDKFVLESGFPINVSLFEKNEQEAFRPVYPLHDNKLSKIVRVFWWLSSVKVIGISNKIPRNLEAAMKRFLIPLRFLFSRQTKKKIAKKSWKWCVRFGGSSVDWRVPLHYFKDFDQISFYKKTWLVPKKTEKYLVFRYGKDWKIPRTDWSSTNEDAAINQR